MTDSPHSPPLSPALSSPLAPQLRAPLDVSIVVPVYGGEGTITELTSRAAQAMASRGWSWELILVCDRPPDGSWAVAQALAAEYPEVSAVHLRRNFGQHPATLLGIRRARGRTIVTMDEDMQHAPSDIPTLVETSLRSGAIAYGVTQQPQNSLWRNATAKTAKWVVARYLGFQADEVSAFRAFPSVLRTAFEDYRGERVAVDVLLSWAGAPVTAVPCSHAPRADGRSGYTFRKLVSYLMDLVLGYSTAPLRVASWLGLAAVFVAMLIAAFVLLTWLVYGSVVPGFAFLALSVAAFSGVQLLSLGLIGEYLGRLYFNALGKPQYLIDQVIGAGAEVAESTPPTA